MRKGMAIAAAMVAAIAAGGAWRLASGDAATVAPPRTHTVALGDVEDTVAAVGSLQPRNYVDVGTQVSGQLRSIHVEVGDRVEQGRLLAEIDPTVYETRVAADQAQLKVLRANLQERRVQLELAEKQFDRQRRLRETRTASEEAYDSADAARKQIAAQILALEANIQQSEASLKANQANLGYTRIYAPMSGTVIDVTARRGQTLNANQQAPIILRIADLDVMTVQAQVSEADVARLKIGMPVRFTTLGRPDRPRYGTLRQILPTPETVNNVVLYKSLFDAPNPDLDLLPSMSAQVFFVVSEAKNVPLAPLSALKRLGRDRYAVKVVGEDGAVAERTVQTGASNRFQAEIRQGLAPGERIVADGGGGAGESGRRGPGASGPGGPPGAPPGPGGPPPGMGPRL